MVFHVGMSSLELRAADVVGPAGTPFFQGLSCRFAAGELAVVSGLSGSGKSRLAAVAAGLERPVAGSVLADGRPLGPGSRGDGRRVAAAAQDPLPWFLARTVEAELELCRPAEGTAASWLSWAQLENRSSHDPRRLSAGEARRLALSLAFASAPDFLILDDPFAGLDHAFVPRVLEAILARRGAGAGVIVCTNDFEKILAHADRLLLLKAGRVIADALPERVLPYLDAHGFRKPTLKLSEMSWLKGGA